MYKKTSCKVECFAENIASGVMARREEVRQKNAPQIENAQMESTPLRVVRVFLASDAVNGVRSSFASSLTAALKTRLKMMLQHHNDRDHHNHQHDDNDDHHDQHHQQPSNGPVGEVSVFAPWSMFFCFFYGVFYCYRFCPALLFFSLCVSFSEANDVYFQSYMYVSPSISTSPGPLFDWASTVVTYLNIMKTE
jgi:ABC-type nickel/cobalt efflux system permease component RcnA